MVGRFELEEGFDIEPHSQHNEQITIVFDVFSPVSDQTGIDQG